MSLTYGFYNSLNGDRRYTAEQLSRIFDGVINDGVFMSVGEQLKVHASGSLRVFVASGRAWFDGTWTDNDSVYYVTIPEPELVLNRIDAVVLEVSHDEHVRANSIKVISGTPASKPSRPAMSDTATTKRYPLAYVAVNAGVTAIKQSDITNAVGTSECPWVTGILETVDTDELIEQWVARFDEIYAELENAIEQTLAAQIVDGSIVTSKLANNAVTTSKIANNAVTADKIAASGVLSKIGGASMDYARKVGAPKNLLDNSDFTNPVNQRNITTFSKPDYFIDRWTSRSSLLKISLTADGIAFTNEYDNYLYPEQRFKKGTFKIGTTYTLVAYMPNGDFTVQRIIPADNTMTPAYVVEHNVQWFIGTDNAAHDRVGIMIPAGKSAVVSRVAIYEGEYTKDTIPEYQPKGYAAELAECQRYYLANVGQFLAGSFMVNSNAFRAFVPIPVSMRTTPTVTLVNGDSIIWACDEKNGVIPVTGATIVYDNPGGVVVSLTTESNPGAYVTGHTFLTSLCLSADF